MTPGLGPLAVEYRLRTPGCRFPAVASHPWTAGCGLGLVFNMRGVITVHRSLDSANSLPTSRLPFRCPHTTTLQNSEHHKIFMLRGRTFEEKCGFCIGQLVCFNTSISMDPVRVFPITSPWLSQPPPPGVPGGWIGMTSHQKQKELLLAGGALGR